MMKQSSHGLNNRISKNEVKIKQDAITSALAEINTVHNLIKHDPIKLAEFNKSLSKDIQSLKDELKKYED